jgi:hypothetical protein
MNSFEIYDSVLSEALWLAVILKWPNPGNELKIINPPSDLYFCREEM